MWLLVDIQTRRVLRTHDKTMWIDPGSVWVEVLESVAPSDVSKNPLSYKVVYQKDGLHVVPFSLKGDEFGDKVRSLQSRLANAKERCVAHTMKGMGPFSSRLLTLKYQDAIALQNKSFLSKSPETEHRFVHTISTAYGISMKDAALKIIAEYDEVVTKLTWIEGCAVIIEKRIQTMNTGADAAAIFTLIEEMIGKYARE